MDEKKNINKSLVRSSSTDLVRVNNSLEITNKILTENSNRYLNNFSGQTLWSVNLFDKISVKDIIDYNENNEVIVAGSNGIIYFLSKKDGAVTNKINIGIPVYKLCLVKNDVAHLLFAGVMSGELFKINLGNDLNYSKFQAHRSAITGVLFSKQFNSIITTSTDGHIKIWDILKDNLIKNIDAHILTESFGIYNDIVISSGLSGEIKFHSLPELKLINVYKGNKEKEFQKKIAINNKLNRLALGSSMESTINILNLNDLTTLKEIKLNMKFAIGDLCYSSDDKYLCAACNDGTVKIFDAVSSELKFNYDFHQSIANKEIEKKYGGNRILASLFDANNKNLFTGDMSGNVNYWM